MRLVRASRSSRRVRWTGYRSATGAVRRAGLPRDIAGAGVRLATEARTIGRVALAAGDDRASPRASRA